MQTEQNSPGIVLKLLTILIVVSACTSVHVSGNGPADGPPDGQANPEMWFLLQPVDALPPPAALDSVIDGISVRVSWAMLEPSNNEWNWDNLDRQFAWAEANQKLVMLRVMAGVMSPDHSYDTTADGIPTPWEPRHTAEFAELMQALGDRYASRDVLTLVHVSGFWTSAEFHVPQGLGFDSRMIDAFIERIHATALAFPEQNIALNHSPEPFSLAVIKAAQELIPVRVTFQMNALKATTRLDWIGYTLIRDLGLEGWDIGWQFVGPSANTERFGGPFEQAVNKGRAGHPKYWEVYLPDVPAISAVIDSP